MYQMPKDVKLLVKCSHHWVGSLACLYHPCPALPWLRGDSLGDNLQFLGKLSCLRPQEDLRSTSSLTYYRLTSIYVTANSHYFEITESSQALHPVIIQVKVGQVQQNELGTIRPYPSGNVQACLSFYTARANHPLLPWCSPSLPFQAVPLCLGMLFALQRSLSGTTEPKGELMMTQVI